MEIPLNAMDSPSDGESTSNAPAFTLPMRGNSVSMSSLLSNESDVAAARVGADVAPIAVPRDPAQPDQQHQQQQQHELSMPIGPHRPRARSGLSALMNSPMDDDVVMQDPRGYAHPPPIRTPTTADERPQPTMTVTIEAQSPVAIASHTSGTALQHPHDDAMDGVDGDSAFDAHNAQHELEIAIARYLAATDTPTDISLQHTNNVAHLPPPKRHKKGKHARSKVKASALSTPTSQADAQRADVVYCITRLYARIDALSTTPTDVLDVVQLCLTLCTTLQAHDERFVVAVVRQDAAAAPGAVDIPATLAALPSHVLSFELLCVVRHALERAVSPSAVLTSVLSFLKSQLSSSLWVFAFLAETGDSFAILEFLLHEQLVSNTDEQDASVSNTVTAAMLDVVDYLVYKHPTHAVDIVTDVLGALASTGSTNSFNDIVVPTRQRQSVRTILCRLVQLATQSKRLVEACAANLHVLVTRTCVERIAVAVSSSPDGSEQPPLLSTLLLTLVTERAQELATAHLQLLLLLLDLQIADATMMTSSLAADAATFHALVFAFAASNEAGAHAFLASIQRCVPFVCHTALHALYTSSTTRTQTFLYWRAWLELLANRLDATAAADIPTHLVDADRMLAEGERERERDACDAVISNVTPYDLQLAQLLRRTLPQTSKAFGAFIETLLMSTSSRYERRSRVEQRRVLAIVQALLLCGDMTTTAVDAESTNVYASLSLPPNSSLADAIEQLSRIDTWRNRCDRFALWRSVQGIASFERFVDLAASADHEIAARALVLIAHTPFDALEEPMWQFRCFEKLTRVYFGVLWQHRHALVRQDATTTTTTTTQLGALERVLVRLVTLDGGVAHYATSVFTTFASLWVDALLRPDEATTIPTHAHVQSPRDDATTFKEPVVQRKIRLERTIRAKWTTAVEAAHVTTQRATDALYAREMDAAHACSLLAVGVLRHVLQQLTSNSSATIDHKLDTVVDFLLERALPSCGLLSDDVYKETLPNRSSHDMELRIEQWLHHLPTFLPLLQTIVTTAAGFWKTQQSLRVLPVIKSTLVVLIGHWNSVKGDLERDHVDVPPYLRNRYQLALTCDVVRILQLTNWLPVPLSRVADLLPLTSPADIRGILFSCWFFLSDHAPSTAAFEEDLNELLYTGSPPMHSSKQQQQRFANVPLEFYLVPLRKALHRNIGRIGAKYPLFMC